MTKRALISIGCNQYEYLKNLSGAEHDARSVFDALTQPSIGEYDIDKSRLLLSPTVADVKEAINDVLFSADRIDTFVLFFAGHGGTKAGSFFMCCRDTRDSALSSTALSLSNVFLNVAEAQPGQTNIIIDACQSGGLIADLGVILKPELLGDAGTPGITLLATSARDQASGENDKGGIGTNALLDCICGNTFIQDIAPTLDLIEIGRSVSETISRETKQTPVVWGLNLYGAARFCRNPYFQAGPSTSLRQIAASWPASLTTRLQEIMPRLWEVYLSIDSKWSPIEFRISLTEAIESLSSSPDSAALFVDRLSISAIERARQSRDQFRSVEVLAACCAALLPVATRSHTAAAVLSSLVVQTFDEAERALDVAINSLMKEKYALLAGRGGLSDFFFLPVRISKLIGWAGAAIHFRQQTKKDAGPTASAFRSLLNLILEHYSTSINSVSDSQAAPLALGITGAYMAGLLDEGEVVTSFFFNTLLSCKGKVAARSIEPERILSYLISRQAGQLQSDYSLVAQPSELITVLLRAAPLFGLGEVFDDTLYELDHVHCMAYVPDDFANFGAERIPGGNNYTFWIGHNVWSVADLARAWPESGRVIPSNSAMFGGAMLASMIYPDRVAWFTFEGVSGA